MQVANLSTETFLPAATQAYWHWNAAPELLTVGSFSVRWYGLLFAAGFLFGYMIMSRIFKTEGRPTQHLDPLLTYMFVGTLLGARLGHCLFYEADFYFQHPIEIIKVWKGGLASHGAVIGIISALYLFSRRYMVGLSYPTPHFLWLLDRLAVVVPLAGALIRLGNFFNSEIYGKPSMVPWAVVFERVDDIPRHPTQLYESLSYLIIFAVISKIYWRSPEARGREQTPRGLLIGLFFMLIFGARFLLEYTKNPQTARDIELMLTTGQLLSIPLILAGIALVRNSLISSSRPKKA